MVLDPKRSDVAIKQLQKMISDIKVKGLSFDDLTPEQKQQLKGDSYILTDQDKQDIADLIGGGGGGGADNYNLLSNKPKINGNDLMGDKTSSQLGLADEVHTHSQYLTEHQDISGKQDVITDLALIRSGASLGASALQSESDPTVPSWAKQPNKPTYTANEVGALPSSTPIFSGDYNDLSNKPTIPTVPTNVGAFSNDVGYLTEHQSLNGYATEDWVEAKHYLTEHQSLVGYATENWVNGKGYLTEHQQLKTINNQSIIGTGNITISGGGGTVPTNLSEFTDDLGSSPVHTHSQYLTQHQSLNGYATESWVENKGYLTKHQSLDNCVKKTGDQTMSGSLTVEGHNQEIGYSNSNGGSKSVSSTATFSDLTSFTLSKGTWILVGEVYGSLASAKRLGSVWALNYGSGAENYLASRNIISTGASGNHATQSVLVTKVSTSATAYLRAFHTNGSTLSLDWAWRLVRIA